MSERRGDAARAGFAPTRRDLEARARAAGIAVSFLDQAGERRRASTETLRALLAALGQHAPATRGRAGGGGGRRSGEGSGDLPGRGPGRRPESLPEAVPETVPETVIAWDGRLAPIRLPPPSRGRARAELVLERDSGELAGDPARPAVRERDGALALVVPGRLAYGVHELHVELDSAPGERLHVHVVSAPRHAGAPEGYHPGRWGVFAPAYALRDERGRSSGDLTSLRRLGELAAAHGAAAVATLPLLAQLSSADGGGSHGQAPYSPLSRMWWDEAYLDLARLPELDGVALPAELGARAGGRVGRAAGAAVLAGAGPGRGRSRSGGPADLAVVADAIRPLLGAAASRLASAGGSRREELRRFAARRPDVVRYARFRAAVELHGPDRSRWPAPWRAGRIGAGAVPVEVVERHVYAQFATDAQLAEDAAALSALGCGYLLDLPVGCRPDGYDPWAFPDAFATGASVGAPPDLFFPEGQDWGFPPLHPEGDRRAGYPMLRRCLAHGCAHAAGLRIDHVVGWSRLWWVPRGMPASAGAYVHYRLEELLAVACLESWRHASRLIGEDLGTVEPALQRSLRAHDVAGMRVAVFDLEAAAGERLSPPASSVAYVDTHDTATFAGFVTGAELDLRRSLGLLEEQAAATAAAARLELRRRLAERLRQAGKLPERSRRGDPAPVELLAAVLEELGESGAELVVVNLEDLWAETDPHNVPGTTDQHLNFARRFAVTLEQLEQDRVLLAVLDRLDAARRARVPGKGVAGHEQARGAAGKRGAGEARPPAVSRRQRERG